MHRIYNSNYIFIYYVLKITMLKYSRIFYHLLNVKVYYIKGLFLNVRQEAQTNVDHYNLNSLLLQSVMASRGETNNKLII